MKISQNCLDLIEKWEGFEINAYLDSVGIPTIGYGTIRYPNGVKVKLGDTISKAEAEAFLKSEVDEIVKNLDAPLAGVALNQNQFDAIVCLCYNIGVGGFQGSTVLKKLRAGDFPAASQAFDLWNKGTVNGVKVVIQGLVNRRKDERVLFEKPAGQAADQGVPIDTDESQQDTVTRLVGYRDGGDNVVAAMAGNSVVEISVIKEGDKADLIGLFGQYKNASTFEIAPAGQAIPAGPRIEIAGKSSEIPKVQNAPAFNRLPMILLGSRDDDPGVTGSDVRELQQRLEELGYYAGEVNGIFDKPTDSAVRDFQTDQFGAGEADGRVGPITWGKLWGAGQPAAPAAPTGTFAAGKNYLLLTKTAVKDTSGLFKLNLEYVKDGQSTDSIMVVSGQPKHQKFNTGPNSISKSFEPLPEGKWLIHNLEWAGGKDVYNGKVWDGGLGPVKIRLDYVGPGHTSRQNIEIHIDWNKSTLPGTAGCIGVNSSADYKTMVGWLRDTDPKDLYVDWGLGSVTLP